VEDQVGNADEGGGKVNGKILALSKEKVTGPKKSFDARGLEKRQPQRKTLIRKKQGTNQLILPETFGCQKGNGGKKNCSQTTIMKNPTSLY